MKKEERAKVFDSLTSTFNRAKDNMARAAEELESKGLMADAQTLMRMVYKLEAFQNKYACYDIDRG